MPTTNVVNINNIDLLIRDDKLLKNIHNSTKNDPTIVKKTSRNSNVDTEDEKSGMTPLLYAIFHEHTKIAKRLIDLGADVNKPDNDGKTPLMYASDTCNLNMVNLLIDKGADIKAKSHSLTAFLIAFDKIKDEGDTCDQVANLLNFRNTNGGRRRTTKKNRRVSKSKRYTRATR